ncbi:hypothetical protein [Kitasatospora sp. GAS1066B]
MRERVLALVATAPEVAEDADGAEGDQDEDSVLVLVGVPVVLAEKTTK